MDLNRNMNFSVPKNTFLFQDNAISFFFFTKKYLNHLGKVERRGRSHGKYRKIYPLLSPLILPNRKITINYIYNVT